MNVIQRIVEEHSEAFLKRYGASIPEREHRALSAIRECRTGQRGTHLFRCPDCGESHVAPASCGSRNCPICQNTKTVERVHRQQRRVLPCTHFLATFTLPEPLRPLARTEPKTVYGAMLRCAAESLRTLEADPRFVGCRVAGFFSVLHTWGRQMQFHPHVPLVVPGGGLSADRTRWVAASGSFLVHVKALSRMFRGKMRDTLAELDSVQPVDAKVWTSDWVVNRQPVGDGRAVIKYLGAYVFRPAISASRIAAYDGETVTVRYRKVGSKRWRTMALDAVEFIRRLLQHVLPSGFMKVRHCGFLSPNFSIDIQRIRELIRSALRDASGKAAERQAAPTESAAAMSALQNRHEMGSLHATTATRRGRVVARP